jgi:hypothetical protein
MPRCSPYPRYTMGAMPTEAPALAASAAERWPRPDGLHLQLSVGLGSRVEVTSDEFGWQVWQGDIEAIWDLVDAEDLRYPARPSIDQLPFLANAPGWAGTAAEVSDSRVRLRIGRLERWLLSLDGDDLSGTADNVIESPYDLFDAADAISQSLHEVVAPLVGSTEVLSNECYTLAGNDYLDRLLVLAAVEIVPQLRGYGIGAWASARSIMALARDECTLIVAKAAPLEASEFRTGPDRDSDRDLTPTECAAWDAAQVKIASYWQSRLGMVPLSTDTRILVGTTGSAAEALRDTLAGWAESPT